MFLLECGIDFGFGVLDSFRNHQHLFSRKKAVLPLEFLKCCVSVLLHQFLLDLVDLVELSACGPLLVGDVVVQTVVEHVEGYFQFVEYD